MARVIVVGAAPQSLTNFRGELIRSLLAAGHSVTAMSAPASPGEVKQIEALGASYRAYPIHRSGLDVRNDLKTLRALRAAFMSLKPDVVIAYTIKPVVWGGLGLWGLAGVRFFAMITGLGFAFHGRSIVRRMLTQLVSMLLRAAIGRADGVIFQNADNLEVFVSRDLVPRDKCHLVMGSGVDCEHFVPVPLPATAPVFLLISRLLGDKGLREYAAAARIVKRRYPEATFQLLGEPDPSPNHIEVDEVLSWQRDDLVDYLGSSCDVRPFIASSHVLVLPSYHEGMPRTVLEAMAMARPILTTEVPGCRETVVPGENGFLVPARDPEALAERLIWFIQNRSEWPRMGGASRRMAQVKFEVHKINAQILRLAGLGAEEHIA